LDEARLSVTSQSPEKDEEELSPGKRSLRPRKVGNYQKLLADETTLKSIKDERIEIQQMEPSDLGKRKARVVQEEDEVEEEVEEEEMMLDEVPPDELLEEDEIAAEINEDLESAGEDEYDEEDASEYGVRGSKRKLKAKAKADKSKKRSSSRSKSKTRGSAKRSLKRGRAPINEEDEYEE